MSSVRLKVLAPLSLVGTAIALGSTWWIGEHLAERLHTETRRRVETLVYAVSHVAETVSDDEALQRFVSELGAEPEVNHILVVGGEPLRVLASTRSEWHGVPFYELRDQPFAHPVLRVIRTPGAWSQIQRGSDQLRAIEPLRLADPSSTSTDSVDGAILLDFDATAMEATIGGDMRWILAGCMGAILVFSALAYWLIWNHIISPVDDIAVVIELQGAGDKRAFANVHANDEIGKLASAFNYMLNSIEQHENRFQSLAANVPGVIYRGRMDPARTMEFISEGIHDLTGFDESDFVRNRVRTFASIIHHDDIVRVQNEIQSSVDLGALYSMEYRIRSTAGGWHWVHESGRAIKNADGRTLWLDGVLWDVTERKQAEQAMQLYLVELEASRDQIESQAETLREQTQELAAARDSALAGARAKSEFLAVMSHEIRTPMNGVLGTAELLLDTRLTREQKEYAETLRESGEVLLAVINDTLDFSKIDAGKMTIDPVPTEMQSIFREIESQLSHKAEEKGLRFVASISAGVPQHLEVDPIRVRQIVLNLASNAVKFTHEGSVQLDCDWEPGEGDDGLLKIAVKDTGIGIADNKLETLFEDFTQADSSTTREYGGTGLGLSICKRLVELMDGDIAASCALDQGCTFRFSIPARAVTVEEDDGEPEPSTTDLSGSRILLVEDNRVNQFVAQRMLEKLGCKVSTAANGREALAALEKRDYDVIFMDCQMPVMDGYATTREIRSAEAEGERVPIVAMTANALDQAREKCIEAGMDDYVSKPVRPRELTDVLERWTADVQRESA